MPYKKLNRLFNVSQYKSDLIVPDHMMRKGFTRTFSGIFYLIYCKIKSTESYDWCFIETSSVEDFKKKEQETVLTFYENNPGQIFELH